MKTISADRTYIDYTSGNFGVRVWRDHCQAIARDSESAPWIGRETVFSIPPTSALELPHSVSTPITALAWDTALYENKEHDPELRKLLKAWVTFDDAISRPDSSRRRAAST